MGQVGKTGRNAIFCALLLSPSLSAEPCRQCVPVLCIHGLDQSVNALRPMMKALREAGFEHVEPVSYMPTHGEVGIVEIAHQVHQAMVQLIQNTGAKKIDVVAFSMGALAARYAIQRLDAKDSVRKLISISGPHQGTVTGYLRPFFPSVKDMLPGSDFLTDLAKDEDPWGPVRTYAFYTPYDVLVLPTQSALIKGAKNRAFPVAIHHQMLKDPPVIAAVINALRERADKDRYAGQSISIDPSPHLLAPGSGQPGIPMGVRTENKRLARR